MLCGGNISAFTYVYLRPILNFLYKKADTLVSASSFKSKIYFTSFTNSSPAKKAFALPHVTSAMEVKASSVKNAK